LKNIGKLKDTVLLFGGVYSNFQSLETMKEIAKDLKIPKHNIICTGDIVGYCADPEECVTSIKEWGIHTIAGNVEIQLREGLNDCGCDFNVDSRCDIFARQWYPYAQRKVSKSSVEWLQTIPEFIEFDFYGKKCVVVHGSYFNTSEFVFRSTSWEQKSPNFEKTDSDVIIAGHCGLPFHDVQNEKYWLNPGVIGMPANDGTTRVWYMLLKFENNEFTFEHHSFEYDHEETFARMLETELPISYAKTLTSGLWDNNDILPEEETAEQGRKLFENQMG